MSAPRSPSGQHLRRGVRGDPALGRLQGVHDPQRSVPLFLVVAQRVICGIRARELGLAAALGDLNRRQHRGHLREGVLDRSAPVDVPVERGAQVVRGRVLRLVEGDRVDARHRVMPVGRVVDLAESPAERHLALSRPRPRPGNTSTPLSSSASSTAAPSASSVANRSESTPRTSAPTESVSLLIVSTLMEPALLFGR